MKKSIQCLGIMASIVLLVACGNNSNNKKTESKGTAIFFHYVTGSSTLSLDSPKNDRGLGSVEFANFGSGISLAAKKWDLTVTDVRNETDASDDEVLLAGATFSVTNKRRGIHALIGDYNEGTVELVNLTLGYDVDSLKDTDTNADGVVDDRALYINFSNLHSLLGTLDVYLVDPTNALTPLSALTPTAVVDFKQSSDSIRLPENKNKYYLRIAQHGTNVEIFNSGERTLTDYTEQTIIIAPYVGSVDTGSQITAFYYGNGKSQKWRASDSQGQVRVFNAMKNSTDLNFELTNTDPLAMPPLVDFNKGFNNLSPYVQVDTKFVAYSVKFEENNDYSFFESILEPIVNVEDGQSWTIIPFGPAAGIPYIDPAPSAVVVLEEDTAFANRATITVSNAGYIADEAYRLPYNVHITIPNERIGAFPDGTTSVDIPSLGYADYGVATVNAGITYKLSITDEKNKNFKASPVLFNVEGGENMHFVFMEKAGGGFQIVRLIGEASASRSAIDVSASSVAAGGTVTVKITAKDVGGNKLTTGGDMFTLALTGGAIISAPLTDNGDGTYTATITDATAESVTISGVITIDSVDYSLDDTATVIFTAP